MFLTRSLHSESPPVHANAMHGAKGGDLNMWRRFRRTSCIVQARICGAKSTQVWWVSMPQHVMHARRAYAKYRTRYTYPLLLTPVLPPIGLSTRAYRNFQLISGFSLELNKLRQDSIRAERLPTGRQALGALAPNSLAFSTLPRTFPRSEVFRGMYPDTRSLFLIGCGDSKREARALEDGLLRAE